VEGDQLTIRPARAGDGAAVFEVTRLSAAGLAKDHYSPEQIANWMGERTPDFYEEAIGKGRMVVVERGGVVVAYVDAEPGELTRLFVLPEVAGMGIGARLLEIGLEAARLGHSGPVKVEASINAEAFYRRFGFTTIRRGYFTHGVGGVPIEIVRMSL
jgi:predicted N-acetyltransferase YhbS